MKTGGKLSRPRRRASTRRSRKGAVAPQSLIGQIYESVGDPAALSDVMRQLVGVAGGRIGQFGLLDTRGQWLHASVVGAPGSVLQTYLDLYAENDPRLPSYLSHTGQLLPCHQTVDQALFERSALVNDFLDKMDARYCLASVTPVSPHMLAVISVMRPRRDGRYESAEQKALAPFLPHVWRALSLQIRLGGVESSLLALEALVDRLSSPVLVVDRDGTLRHANEAGRAALARGVFLTLRKGRVEPCNAKQARDFALLVASALSGEARPGNGMRLLGGERRFATLAVYPLHGLPTRAGVAGAAAALFLTGYSTVPLADSVRLQALFRLTPAETRLVEWLLQGESPREISERFHLSRETTKSQLHSLFEKTGTRRQTELIATLLSTAMVKLT